MFIPSFKEIKEVTDSRYKLAVMISKRARQLKNGYEPLIEEESPNEVTIAFKEIMQGYVKTEDEE